MKVYATEEEQIQALQNWFKRNGVSLAIGIMFTLAAVLGWNAWQNYSANYQSAASTLFETLQNSKNTEQQVNVAHELVSNYSSSVYSKIAALYLTNSKVQDNKWQEAVIDYKKIYDQTSNWPDLQVVVFENWIRAQLELKDTAKAYQEIEKAENNTKFAKEFPLNFYNLKGDVLHANGNNSAAVDAYNQAIDYSNANPELMQQTGQFVNWLILKRNDLLEAKPLK